MASDDNTGQNDDQATPQIRKRSDRIVSPISSGIDELAELAKRAKELASQADIHSAKSHGQVLDLDHDKDQGVIKELRTELTPVQQKNSPEHPASYQKVRHKGFAPKGANQATELIRNKIANLYKSEPDPAEEAMEAYESGGHRSKHQQFMLDLTNSGKSLAHIQTEWHNYYVNLPDNEKHQVWQEFYRTQDKTTRHPLAKHSGSQKPQAHTTKTNYKPAAPDDDPRTVAEIKSQLLNKISAGGKLSAKHHIKSLAFGLSMALTVSLLMMFTFFNEVFIAPFISPSRTVTATPIIGDSSSAVGLDPKIIIPKINLEVPVVYDAASTSEKDVQNALERGVVHYLNSPLPGEIGNSVIVGHSSNNILNKGKYKFAFVLLKKLEVEDTILIHHQGVRYTYKVYKKVIVEPNDVSVLGNAEKPNTLTLITCDPPGTSLRRLIIQAEQISPDPNANKASTQSSSEQVQELPSNAPSLWSRLFD